MDLNKKHTAKQNKNEKNDKNMENSANRNGEEEIEKNKRIDEKNIRIYSYNSRGFDMIKQKYCNEILTMDPNSIPVLCNQENFILEGNRHVIQNALQGFHAFIKPATKEHVDGRPAIGMFIAILKELRNKAKDVTPRSNRIQAIILETNEGDLMIINVYFPADPKTRTYQLEPDLEDMLASITTLIDNYHCNNVIITGDFNMDKKRDNGRVDRIKKFLMGVALS